MSTGAPSPLLRGGIVARGRDQVPARATASPARAWTSSVVTGPGSGPGGRVAGAEGRVVLVVGALVRWARARRQAVTPLPVSTPRPSGNALARSCGAA